MSESATDLRKEYFETTREEILWRIGHRDQWLKIQLLAQIAIFGLANGVDLGFIKAASPIDIAVAFAFPTSLVLAILYVVEDRLIGLAGAYLGALAQATPRADGKLLLPFDASPQLRQYAEEGTLIVRVAGQFLAFSILPTTIAVITAVTKSRTPAVNPPANLSVLLISVSCAVFVLILLAWSYRLRRKAGTLDSSSVLVDTWPAAEAGRLTQWQRAAIVVVVLASILALGAGLWALI